MEAALGTGVPPQLGFPLPLWVVLLELTVTPSLFSTEAHSWLHCLALTKALGVSSPRSLPAPSLMLWLLILLSPMLMALINRALWRGRPFLPSSGLSGQRGNECKNSNAGSF